MALNDQDELELAALREPTDRVGAAARRVTPLDTDFERPPADLWDRIEGELGFDADPATGATDAEQHHETEELADVIPISRFQRYVRPLLVAAAVLALVAVAVGTIVANGDDGSDKSVVASAELEPLGEAGAGSAELISTTEGEFALRVEFSGVTAEDGFHEVWLLDPDVTQLVSLGPARPDGLYQVPAGLDPTVVPVVDVSFEIFDGDPSHGGNSVLRGVLQA